jgi:hypothetical protein
MKYALGRYTYGLTAIGFGVCALVFHDIGNWLQLKTFADVAHNPVVVGIVALVQIVAGVALLWPRTERAAALVLGALYLVFAALIVPAIVRHPLVFDGYGNFFELFAFVSGAAILYGRTGRLAQFGYYSFGIGVISFGLYQLAYLSYTASLVPKWIPPSQMFWAIATTVAFLLAATALLTGFMARLASVLNTAMILGFGLLVWLPAVFAKPQTFGNWTEFLETIGIAATAWIVTGYLFKRA